MPAYTKEQFQQYKGDKPYLVVSYEYGEGNWEEIAHESYEDYINCYTSYQWILKTDYEDEE